MIDFDFKLVVVRCECCSKPIAKAKNPNKVFRNQDICLSKYLVPTRNYGKKALVDGDDVLCKKCRGGK